MRRDQLRDGDKVKSVVKPRVDFLEMAVQLLAEIQAGLYAEAKARLDNNIRRDILTFEALAAYFGEDEESFKGWIRAPWSRPGGEELEAIGAKLKALKLTIRNAPADQPATFGPCLFTGKPGVEEILIGRAY
jgi:prolyl-tRNA synthetase